MYFIPFWVVCFLSSFAIDLDKSFKFSAIYFLSYPMSVFVWNDL